jgi:hypothetical protein
VLLVLLDVARAHESEEEDDGVIAVLETWQ